MATTPKAAKATKTYQVLTALEHDGQPYKAGEPIELTDEQAKPLLDVKAVAPAAA